MYSQIVAGLSPSVRECIAAGELGTLLAAALDQLPAEIFPPHGNILAAFRGFATMDDIRVTIIGEDPYPNSNADGLAFSRAAISGETVPQSLHTIVDAAVHQGVSATTVYNLDNWRANGVLLLNTYLTAESARVKHVFWHPYTRALISKLAHSVFMLWGRHAQQFRDVILAANPAATIYATTHPSPLAQNRLAPAEKFAQTVQFREVAALLNLPDIWQLTPAKIPTETTAKIPTETTAEITADIPIESIPIEIPADILTENTADIPIEIPADITVESITEIHNEIPTEIPADIPAETTVESIPTEIPADIPAETTVESIPTEIPADIPVETTADIPTEIPADIPAETTVEIPIENTADIHTEITAEIIVETTAETTAEIPADITKYRPDLADVATGRLLVYIPKLQQSTGEITIIYKFHTHNTVFITRDTIAYSATNTPRDTIHDAIYTKIRAYEKQTAAELLKLIGSAELIGNFPHVVYDTVFKVRIYTRIAAIGIMLNYPHKICNWASAYMKEKHQYIY